VSGSINPVGEIARTCHEQGVALLVDGTHSVPRIPVDVEELGCDFFCFSGDRMPGPPGIGALWMRNPVSEPLYIGGGMVGTVSREAYTFAEGYQRYEAGTPNVVAGIGLGASVDYLAGIGMERIRDHEACLAARLIGGLRGLPGVKVHGPDPSAPRAGIVSFTVDGLDPREVAVHLDEASDILVGAGDHDCPLLREQPGLSGGTVRAGVSLFTTEQEVDLLVATVAELVRG
jgi:cysteine desulfurase/selenocysteine lyase